MKALQLVDKGTDKIAIQSVDKPGISKQQALVRIKAAALNHRDQWCREGRYPNLKYGTVLGSDGAGVVEAVGDPENAHWMGEDVVINPNIGWGSNPAVQSATYQILGMPTHGTFAEYIAVDTDRLHKKPSHLSIYSSAALPLAGLTAYRTVFRYGEVRKGMKVLVSGIGGGVAPLILLFARALQAEVYVTSSRLHKVEGAKKMGAAGGFLYTHETWYKDALAATGGFDVVIDSAGGEQLNNYIRVVKPAGKIIFYGATAGLPSGLDMRRLFWNQITLQGSTMGNDQEFKAMLDFVEKQKIEPVIDSLRPFDDIITAFNVMRDGKQFGKLVVGF